VGLGRAFLRHIERCRLLVHVVDGCSADPVGDFEAVRSELSLFSPWLANKPSVVVLNKCDVPEVRADRKRLVEELRASAGHNRVLPISAATREKCEDLMQRLRKLLPSIPAAPLPEVGVPVALDEDAGDGQVRVEPVGEGEWRLAGSRIERAAAMTNWDYYEAQERFQRIMKALGASEKLRAAGAENGDLIMVGNVDFVYFDENPMAARARLAGFGEGGEDYDDLEQELDAELANLLDAEGDVMQF
jgi:GTP-binding protein